MLVLESYCTTLVLLVKLLLTVNVERRVESVTSDTVTWKSVELGILGKIYQSAMYQVGTESQLFPKIGWTAPL